MSAPANRWKLGLFVVGVTVAGIGGLTWLGMTALERPTRTAWVFFDEAVNGLEKGSPVKFRGVAIGAVDDIGVAQDRKHIAVRAALRDDRLVELGLDPQLAQPGSTLPPGLRAQLVTAWVTQTSFVQVDFFPDDAAGPQQYPFPLPPNTIRAVPSTMKSFEDGARQLLTELPGLATSSRQLLDELRQDLKAVNVQDLGGRAARLLSAMEERVAKVEEMAVLQRATGAFGEVEQLAREWRRTDGPGQQLLRDLAAMAAQLQTALAKVDPGMLVADARGALSRVDAAAGSFADLAGELRAQLRHVQAASAAIERLANLLERDPGALLHGRAPVRSPLQEK